MKLVVKHEAARVVENLMKQTAVWSEAGRSPP
jgi:hypothetical protein